MTTHTAGPWFARDWTHGKTIATIAIGPELMGRGERPVAKTCGRAMGVRKGEARSATEPTAEDWANAHLIAAAPEMLAELHRLFERYGHQATADAIKKATGQ